MPGILQEFAAIDWTDPNLRWVLLGSTLLGIAAAVLGCFAFLRGRSLMGDALAHAALPGVCLAYMTAEAIKSKGWLNVDSKSLLVLMLGASVTGIAAAWCISFVARHSRIKEDAAQAIMLSLFFGAGVVLLTRIQHSNSGNQSGLDKYLFGQAAALVLSDVITMAVVALVLCLLTGVLYKELKLLCFDADFGNGLGLPMRWLDGLLLIMIVVAVVIGLQAVGVVLVSAMLIIPPAAARFWTEKLHRMVPLAAVMGGLSGAIGAVLSAMANQLPTGPLIVLGATSMFIFSVLFAPRRGAIARAWQVLSTRRLVRRENVLRDLFEATEAALPTGDWSPSTAAEYAAQFGGVPEAQLLEKRHISAGVLQGALSDLRRAGLVQQAQGHWKLTPAGLKEGYEVVRRHRLWEMFLMHETSLGSQSVTRDADAVEHFLTPEAIAQLESLLRRYGLEPRLKPMAG